MSSRISLAEPETSSASAAGSAASAPAAAAATPVTRGRSVNWPRAGDAWGGLAAMLVALPAAIAYGVTIYFPFGSVHAVAGALAGILGAIALGLLAPALGGTLRLISAPCAPAAAVLAAFGAEFMQGGGDVATALVLLALLGAVAGMLQIGFGALRLGQLIVYMPYPVVSGYLSGVGLYIIAGQVPKLLGAPRGMHFWDAVLAPSAWQWQGLVVGAVTALVMVGAPRVIRMVPAAIVGLAAGVAAYFALAWFDPGLLQLENNPLVVGALGGGEGSFGAALAARWQALGGVGAAQLELIAVPALTLAVLLSIDTLKTCVVLDAMTRSRHDSNRELIGQGVANLGSALVGGVPGSGTMGPTLVNIASGAAGRWSGVLEGLFALAAYLVLGSLLAWVPVAALAAILIVIGVRMIDRHSLVFLRQRETVLDFVVIVAVVVTALTVSLIAASGIGVALAVLLFLREQIGGAVVRRKTHGDSIFSKRVRTEAEMHALVAQGKRLTVVELQGSLFFGTAHQLTAALAPELKTADYIILDMRRVQGIDVTAAHVLELVEDALIERKAMLVFSALPRRMPTGRDVRRLFDQIGLVRPERHACVFAELDDALEWVEDRLLEDAARAADGDGQAASGAAEEAPLKLHELEIFQGRREQTIAALRQHMEARSVPAGGRIFAAGETGDELFIIRRGLVRIVLPVSSEMAHHLGTFGRGAFFGEMAFLDGAPRSADAVAHTDVDLYVLSRKVFDGFAEEHKKLALGLMEGLASVLASRLRFTNSELRALEE